MRKNDVSGLNSEEDLPYDVDRNRTRPKSFYIAHPTAHTSVSRCGASRLGARGSDVARSISPPGLAALGAASLQPRPQRTRSFATSRPTRT